MKTKICFKCNKEKPLDEFSKHPEMADGYLGKCKACAREDGKYYYRKNMEDSEWHTKEKERTQKRYHRLGYKDKYKSPTDKKRIINHKHNSKFPERIKAKNSSQRLPCPRGLHKHHWSYNQEDWKDFIILTIKDHNLLHRNIIYDQSIFMFRNAIGELLNTKQSHLDVLACAKLSEKISGGICGSEI